MELGKAGWMEQGYDHADREGFRLMKAPKLDDFFTGYSGPKNSMGGTER